MIPLKCIAQKLETNAIVDLTYRLSDKSSFWQDFSGFKGKAGKRLLNF